MELHTVQRIEQYLCDALIASPLVPLNVNVMRLADAIEHEGVVNQTNNIVVRYTGSSNNTLKRIPLVYEKNLTFELNFSCQNYLSSSGHDFATQLLAAAEITISGGVPSGAGVEVTKAFTCESTLFTGINQKSSQYTYTQSYSVTVSQTMPYVALDPCVQRGDCRQLFPGLGVETKLPLGGVVDEATGEIYVPWYTGDDPDLNVDACKGVRWSNELTNSGNWVFICDPQEIFIEDPIGSPIYLLSNNSYTEDGRLVVTIWDATTREPLREVFYCSTGKKIARYAVELWRNTITERDGALVSPNARLDSSFTTAFTVGEFAVVKGAFSLFYQDPLNPQVKTSTLDGGTLIGVVPDTFIQGPSGRFYFVAQSPQGKGWLPEGSFEYASINSLWKLGCLPCEGNSGPPILC
jgi:hypothetical protein